MATNGNDTVGGGDHNTASGGRSTVAGGTQSTASGYYSTIGGGYFNIATNNGATIGGGVGNFVGGLQATIAGGSANTNIAYLGTIGGGIINLTTGDYSTVAGGQLNSALNTSATVSGGQQNVASGYMAVIPGGMLNNASGDYSFAAGTAANAIHKGAFVWADSQSGLFNSTANNQFDVRASGGVLFTSGTSGLGNETVSWTPGSGGWSFSSDRNLKDRFENVNAETVLDKVIQLPITEWSYQGYAQRHIGAMAQDFHALFPLNDNDKVLNDADLHGVELAAIKGLNQKLNDKNDEIQGLKVQNELLAKRLSELERTVQSLTEIK